MKNPEPVEGKMSIAEQARAVMREFFEKIEINRNELIVLGLSTSEVMGSVIGTSSAPEVGEDIVSAALSFARERGVDLAVQCCEHLNRALIIERAAATRHGCVRVSVIPYPHAGGSAATAAYAMMEEPVVVEAVSACSGIDIGVTMIGMHLRPVVVPVRTSLTIGSARVDYAYARPKLIGGERARYQ